MSERYEKCPSQSPPNCFCRLPKDIYTDYFTLTKINADVISINQLINYLSINGMKICSLPRWLTLLSKPKYIQLRNIVNSEQSFSLCIHTLQTHTYIQTHTHTNAQPIGWPCMCLITTCTNYISFYLQVEERHTVVSPSVCACLCVCALAIESQLAALITGCTQRGRLKCSTETHRKKNTRSRLRRGRGGEGERERKRERERDRETERERKRGR